MAEIWIDSSTKPLSAIFKHLYPNDLERAAKVAVVRSLTATARTSPGVDEIVKQTDCSG